MTSDKKNANFLDWLQTVNIKNEDILILKKAYFDGFDSGYYFQHIMLVEEQLQK